MSIVKREPGFYPDVPSAEYHAGLTLPRPLSSTVAKNLIRKLPAEAEWALNHAEDKQSFTEGTAIHELVLEGELKTVVELEFDSYRTKDAKAARDLAILDGEHPMLSKDLKWIRNLANTVRVRPDVEALISTGGDAEMSALAEIGGVPVQARFDYLRLPDETHKGYVLDLKTVAGSANPRDFQRNAAAYGYHISAAHYLMVLESLGYEDIPFFWLVVSKSEPYAHCIVQASKADLEIGQALALEALSKWEKVLTEGWPTTTPIIQSSLPAWTASEAMEAIK